ncbi:alpha/beta-hydrolase [Plenodomus tracheiphilus IPT5]|uniref:Alpha/beta-hydrolase n=1 Tax=Plenodomus tracheiphilus IPT5 TaxID=1408161 RepID=A0A6A7AQN2_9PLEO|nr:alpha/beta-hydrolase [Plenodomus tracheiphilus IPT5]
MKTSGQCLLTLGAIATTAAAQNFSYVADNFYRSPNVILTPIIFPNQFNHTITGNIFTPLNTTLATNSSPAIVISHPMGAVKEQSANLYAQKLAEQGFITVAFDLPFYGGSEGYPRNSVSPDLYAEAFSAAIDYLGTLNYIDKNRIGGLGICGSGSFIISAAKIDPRMRAIATSSMYDMGAVSRHGLRNALSLSQRKDSIAAAAHQRWNEHPGTTPLYGLGTPLILTNGSTPIDREFFDFYRTSRGSYTPPNGNPIITTGRTDTSAAKFMNFYPFNDIETISPRPMLFVAGTQAHSLEFSEQAFAQAGEPKELLLVEGAGHVDLYDRVELIPFGPLTRFFREHLS